MSDYDGSFPPFSISAPYGSATIRGTVSEVRQILLDAGLTPDDAVKLMKAAVKSIYDQHVGGFISEKAAAPTKHNSSPPASSGGKKYPDKRPHPEGKTCEHGKVLVEAIRQRDGGGYWVCGETQRLGGSEGCVVNDDHNTPKNK